MQNDHIEQEYYENSQNFETVAKTQSAIKEFMESQQI
jgi:hypothetical protein